jgi:hypothetical protein
MTVIIIWMLTEQIKDISFRNMGNRYTVEQANRDKLEDVKARDALRVMLETRIAVQVSSLENKLDKALEALHNIELALAVYGTAHPDVKPPLRIP